MSLPIQWRHKNAGDDGFVTISAPQSKNAVCVYQITYIQTFFYRGDIRRN